MPDRTTASNTCTPYNLTDSKSARRDSQEPGALDPWVIKVAEEARDTMRRISVQPMLLAPTVEGAREASQSVAGKGHAPPSTGTPARAPTKHQGRELEAIALHGRVSVSFEFELVHPS